MLTIIIIVIIIIIIIITIQGNLATPDHCTPDFWR